MVIKQIENEKKLDETLFQNFVVYYMNHKNKDEVCDSNEQHKRDTRPIITKFVDYNKSNVFGFVTSDSFNEYKKQNQKKTWQQKLFELIDEKDLKDSDVYTNANISRQAFSKIRNDIYYHPKKDTAIAFCFALGLDDIL